MRCCWRGRWRCCWRGSRRCCWRGRRRRRERRQLRRHGFNSVVEDENPVGIGLHFELKLHRCRPTGQIDFAAATRDHERKKVAVPFGREIQIASFGGPCEAARLFSESGEPLNLVCFRRRFWKSDRADMHLGVMSRFYNVRFGVSGVLTDSIRNDHEKFSVCLNRTKRLNNGFFGAMVK